MDCDEAHNVIQRASVKRIGFIVFEFAPTIHQLLCLSEKTAILKLNSALRRIYYPKSDKNLEQIGQY